MSGEGCFFLGWFYFKGTFIGNPPDDFGEDSLIVFWGEKICVYIYIYI